MEVWKKYKLGELITLRYGKDHKKIEDGHYPIYGSGGLMRYGNEYIYDQPSILIPRKGSLNNIMFMDKPFWTVDTMFWSIINQENVLPCYLYYILSKYDFSNLNVGSAVPSLTVSVIEAIEVSVPNIEKQKQILSILIPIDEKIALNTRINDNLEQQAQALCKSWFVDFEPFKGGKFVDSELGKIPEGWTISSLESVASIIKTTISPFNFPNKVFEHYSIPAYDTNMMASYEQGTTILSNKYKIDSNCVLLSKLNPRIKRIWLPICKTTNSICSTEFVAYKPINDNILPYLYTLISSSEFYGFILSLTNGSTGSHQRFQPQASLEYIFAKPSSDIIYEFSKVIAPILSNKHKNQLEIESLSNLRDSLLPKLMSGELKINDLHS